jgi:CheY-like chemotaxis protein
MAKTILLVDDDVDLLRSVAELLRGSGYAVARISHELSRKLTKVVKAGGPEKAAPYGICGFVEKRE